jgi:hypothetical protein
MTRTDAHQTFRRQCLYHFANDAASDAKAGFEIRLRRKRRSDRNYVARDLATKRCENDMDTAGLDAFGNCFRSGFYHRIGSPSRHSEEAFPDAISGKIPLQSSDV